MEEDEIIIHNDDIVEEITLDSDSENELLDELEDVKVEDEYNADEESVDEDDSETADIHDVEDMALAVFKSHKGAIFVIDVDPKNSQLVVSGGEDDLAYLWDIETTEILLKCEGHKDSVTCASFSADSSLLVTGDMSGFLQVYDIATGRQIWQFETGDLEWVQWHPVAPVLLAGSHDGQCWMWQIPKEHCKIFASHGCATMSGLFLPGGKTAAIGYKDGSLKILDLKTTNVLHVIKGREGHTAAISDLSVEPGGTLIATASIDGKSKLISTATGKVSCTYTCRSRNSSSDVNDQEDTESIECVAFSPTLPLLATGSLNGLLHIWDYKLNSLRHTCKHEQGVTKVKWDPAHCGGAWVYTGSLDGKGRIWDARDGSLVTVMSGHLDHIYDIKVTRDGCKLLSVSADGTARVFKVREKENDPIR